VVLITSRMKVSPARFGLPCIMSLASTTGLARLSSTLRTPFCAGAGTTLR
jgi:hypothetical protein